MSESTGQGGTGGAGGAGGGGGAETVQPFSHNPTSARVPERVARGVVATGFLAFFSPNEFVIDFLQLMGRPPQLIARVVMAPAVAEQFLGVLKENLGRYVSQFGQPPVMPKGSGDKPRTAQEVYDDIKIPEEALSGYYANNVLVGHTPAEFGIDFITNFIPHAAVSARVYLSAPRVPMLIDTLNGLVNQYRKQREAAMVRPATTMPPAQPQTGYGTAPGIPGFPTPPPPEPPPNTPPQSGPAEGPTSFQ